MHKSLRFVPGRFLGSEASAGPLGVAMGNEQKAMGREGNGKADLGGLIPAGLPESERSPLADGPRADTAW
jgi:hypothetical protein